jgi:hypothetical protein
MTMMTTSKPVTVADFDPFTEAYIEAALWATNDESTPEGGEPFDANYGLDNIHPDSLAEIVRSCSEFQKRAAHYIADEWCNYKRCPVEEYAGHDFFLTRCGHGAGYWDGDWKEPAATKLTDLAKAFGEVWLTLGDDGKIHFTKGKL